MNDGEFINYYHMIVWRLFCCCCCCFLGIVVLFYYGTNSQYLWITFFAVLPRQNFQIKSYKIGSLFSITCTHWKKTRCIEPWLTEFLQLYNRYVLMILKYWKIKFDIEWQLKYLLNNKLAKYSKNNKDKNDPKNMGYYSIIKNVRTE